MNTLTPLNPDVKPEILPNAADPSVQPQPAETAPDTLSYLDLNQPAVEIEQPTTQPVEYTQAQPPVVPPAAPVSFTQKPAAAPTLSSGFLVRYVTTLFAGLSVLWGLSSLGFILLDHFINKPEGVTVGGLFDASGLVSTWHVWLVASLITFVTLYLAMSHAAGKLIANELVSESEFHVADIARSIFTGILIITAASFAASLVFTLLNGTLAAAEIDGKDIAIQVIGVMHAFVWIGMIIWHQSVLHSGGKTGIPGNVLLAGSLALAVLASIFLLAAGRNAVIDSRTVSDLSTIQSALISYKTDEDVYPESLSNLKIDDDGVKSRLVKYTYTRQTPEKSTVSTGLYEDMLSSDSMYDAFTSTSTDTDTVSVGTAYKLCATFLTDASSKSPTASSSYSSSTSSSFYAHKKGEHCVER